MALIAPFEGYNFVWYLLGILFLYFGYQVIKTREKKIAGIGKFWVGFFIVAVLFVSIVNINLLQGAGLAPFAVTEGAPTVMEGAPTVTPTGGICTVEDTTVTLSSVNIFAKGTAVTGSGQHRLFVKQDNGLWKDLGLNANDATITLSPYDQARVIFDENSTGASTGAYSTEIITTIPCKGTYLLEGEVCQFDTSPTITVWNEDGSVNSAAANSTFSADSEYTLPIRLRASNNLCAGSIKHPGNGDVWCFQYPSSNYTSVELDGQVTAPTPNAVTAGVGNVTSCYYVPPESDNSQTDYNLVVKTASAYSSAAGYLNNIFSYLFDVDIDLDADTLETINNVEDEDKNNLGYTTASFIGNNMINIA